MKYDYDVEGENLDVLTERIYGVKPHVDALTDISAKMNISPRMMSAILSLIHVGLSPRVSAEDHVVMGCQIIDDMIAREENYGFLEAVTQWVTSYKDMVIRRHRLKDVQWLAHLGQLTNPYLYIEQILISLAVSGIISIQHAHRMTEYEYEYLDLLLMRYGLFDDE